MCRFRFSPGLLREAPTPPPCPCPRPCRPSAPTAPLWIALLLVAAGAVYLNQSVSWRQGALWIVGALLGVALYHASFGFTQAWRVFVSDRRGAGLRAQMFMLGLGVLLFFPCCRKARCSASRWPASSRRRACRCCWAPSCSASACSWAAAAAGTLFAVGGGNTRMVVTLLFFIVGSVIATANFGWWSALPALAPTSLVKSWGLAPALIANLAVFALIAWTATALEKRRHGHVISFASRTARPVRCCKALAVDLGAAWRWSR